MADIRKLLSEARVIAVYGMSNDAWRDSNRIGKFLIDRGYTVYPVNPTIDEVFGLKSYPTLESVPEQIDVVNVFRNPMYANEVVDDAIAAKAKAIWFQLGAEERTAEARAAEAGLTVVSGRCIAVEYGSLGIRRETGAA